MPYYGTYHVAGIQRGAVTTRVAVYRRPPLQQPRPPSMKAMGVMKAVGGMGIRNAILKLKLLVLLVVLLKVLEEAGVVRPVRVCVCPVSPVSSGRGGVVVFVRGAAKGGGDRVVPHGPRSQGVLRWVEVGVGGGGGVGSVLEEREGE